MKKKIALLSPFISHNYGTVLQAFALQKVINDTGKNCEYITTGFYNNLIEKVLFIAKNPLFLIRLIKKRFGNRKLLKYNHLNGWKYRQISIKNKRFVKEFVRYSTTLYTPNQYRLLNEEYDKFIVGSDQTWSPEIDYHYSPFFLPFVNDKRKKCSYGCSFGTTLIDKFYRQFMKQSLMDFSYLSCRDVSNTKMLNSLLNKKVYNVLDPTLLIDKFEWNKFMTKVEIPNQYILCYILGKKKCISEYADFLSQSINIPVYYILTRPEYENKENILSNIGCQEFLYLIAHCLYLVTDSFHGTIFSINFEKNFESFDKYDSGTGDNGRILDILKEFGLEKHYHRDEDLTMPTSIDYSIVRPKIAEKRKSSIDYLYTIISD